MSRGPLLVVLPSLFICALTGCNALRWHEARFLEETQRYPQALEAYEALLARNDAGSHALEAHVRAADLYARRFQRCLEARRHYEAAARLDENGPWGARARAGLMACPDYFPLELGRVWIYGDSASGGRAMRLEASLRASTGSEGELQSALYAGNKRIRVDSVRYEKRDWLVLERKGSGEAPILRFPFRVGEKWHAKRDGVPYDFRIEADDARVETKAGVFTHCLKVRETNLRFPGSWTYQYYAPFVGRVKTSVAGPGFEHPNTELVRWSAGA